MRAKLNITAKEQMRNRRVKRIEQFSNSDFIAEANRRGLSLTPVYLYELTNFT